MKAYVLQREQELGITISEAWDFFSSPRNLQKITPPKMGFNIVSEYVSPKMYSGQLIEYRVKPLLGIPLKWITEIKNVKDETYFIDEQRFGPYRFWYHEHWFEATEKGVKMIDRVTYGLPMGLLGRLAHRLFVRKQLETIFDYREEQINALYPVK